MILFFMEHLQQYLVILQESENLKRKIFPHLHLAELNLNAEWREIQSRVT